MKLLKALPGIVLILTALVGLWFLGSQLMSWFFGLSTETMTATASIIGVLSVPVITYFTTRSLEKRRSRETAIRERKNAFYAETMTELMSIFDLAKTGKVKSEASMVEVFARIPAPLLTYGSRGVIRSWNNFRRVSASQSGNPVAMLNAFENLFKAMRKDLGHSVLMHQPGELVGVFVNDAEQVMKKQKAT